ncbi:hypothetical protein [Chitinophaga vietnamensis]|uniref:hypothetical protein n=1 Tax=Chitinophaga vietnamensis TaxID=2593957 RepID=UPI00117738C6|nr:hypothetical protein [Chitinophaga vietnamensis]
MKWKLPVALVTAAMSALAFLPAPADWTDRIVKALQVFNTRYPQEKVYLHLDKDYYAGGETIWFKGYVTLQGMPATQATNLYVELLDKNNNIVQKKLFGIASAGAPGFFELPENQKPGIYQLRAYTAWMLNFDPAFFYTRSIEIFDPAKKTAPEADTSAQDFAVQFFPEGGNLMAGQANNIAFKAIDNNGYPIEVSGVIKNGKGAQQANIKSIHDGMGTFEITPADGNDSYQAVIKSAKGQTKTFTLPAAQTTGASLKIYNKGARIFYQAMPGAANDTSLSQLAVIAQMGNQLVYKANLDVSEGRISGFIPTDRLPSGILQVTLFAKNGLPLAERLTFVRKNDQFLMDVLESDLAREPRKKSTVVLRLPDTLQTSISVSVTDADAVPVDKKNASNIISSFLLTSDIKGYVYNPAWYFRNDSVQTLQALDLVMMTNGWRRFSWEKIVKNEMPEVKYPYEQGLLMKGLATLPTGRPLTNGRIDMIIKIPSDSSSMFAQAPVNDKGEFTISNMVFPDTAYIYYQGNDNVRKTKDVSVKFENHFFEKPTLIKIPSPLRVPPPVDNNALKQFLTAASEGNKVNRAINNKTVYLREVNVNAKKPTPEQTTEKRYASGMFSGGDAYSFDLTKETPTALNVFQYLQSKVAGLQITGDINNPSLSWRGGKPGLYLNEMQSDVSMLSSISVNDIALIKVFRPPFMGGFGGANGAIAVYTKKGGDNTGTPDPRVKGFELYKKAGYTIVKQFYSPDYSVKKEVHSLPDKRLTLFWSPNVAVDTLTHTAKIEFYNNDFSKRFRLVAEGIADDGSVGRLEQEF